MINWTAPLSRSRRDDRNAYIERLIWSTDEEVMPSERSAPRSDRSSGDQTGSETGPKCPIRVKSCTLCRVP